MEYIDILDKNGNKTGQIKLREDVHKDGDWHKVAFIFVINNKGEIILQKRSKEKKTNPNKWTASASGHLTAGDDDYEGAVRELEEEIGIKTSKEELQYLFTVKEEYSDNKSLNINHISNVYLLESDIDIKDLRLQKEEVSEVKHVHYKDFEKMLKNNMQEIARHDEMYKLLLDILHKKFD